MPIVARTADPVALAGSDRELDVFEDPGHDRAPEESPGSDFHQLARQVRDAGLFRLAPRRAMLRAVLLGMLFVAGWGALYALRGSWAEMAVAAYLAVVFAQIAFLGHDIGHRQVFRTRRVNSLVGTVCADLGIGISYGYWVDKHDRHHGNPNLVGVDPDVAPGLISWTTQQTEVKSGIRRTLARHQAALFFPLLWLEGANLHISSVRALRTKAVKRTTVEAVLLTVHIVGYLGALLLILPPLRAMAFFTIQQGLFGLYLGCAFAPNHKGMVMPEPGQKLDFLRRQVTTSRNVRGGRLVDVAMGGLNYQIEHHLFPSMPMANLRRCRPMVRAYCSSHGVDYCEAGLTRSYLAALRHLRATGRSLRLSVASS